MKTFLLLLLASVAFAQSNGAAGEANAVLPGAYQLYVDLHQHPELSGHEVRTASVLADKLRGLGYEVTEHVGGTGVVALLKNGDGPTVLLRTELDALPVEEKTGLPYASKVRTKNDAGQEVGVMHACGHDIHLAALYGTAAVMARSRNTWRGTLFLIGQPAEETIGGARGMLSDGLFSRFPKPKYAVAFHDTNAEAAGKVSVSPGYILSNADSIRVTVYGKGAHGSQPQSGIDPVLMAARIVVTLQSIVSREIPPGEAAVVTVGYLHAGTKNNIIPDSAEMGLTVRSYSPEVRKRLLASIDRIVRAEAEAAGAEKPPTIDHYESTPAVYNDPELVARILPTLQQALGKENLEPGGRAMASDDFANYFAEGGVPEVMLSLGAANPEKFREARASGRALPSNHSPLFAPDPEPTLRTGIVAEAAVLRNLLQ
ncbi:MAG: amidohydrolase [Acidobacteria bacterium]|nr:amidohydrolase [Acidobacteriota bacterium]